MGFGCCVRLSPTRTVVTKYFINVKTVANSSGS